MGEKRSTWARLPCSLIQTLARARACYEQLRGGRGSGLYTTAVIMWKKVAFMPIPKQWSCLIRPTWTLEEMDMTIDIWSRVSNFPDFFISRETENLKSQNSREFPGNSRDPRSLFPGKREKLLKFINFPGNGIPGIPGRKL